MSLTTGEFAAQRRIKPASVLSRVCRTGSYFGIRPRKLENGRLLWPEEGTIRHQGAKVNALDGKRYRWLRQYLVDSNGVLNLQCGMAFVAWARDPAQIDAMIDAAISLKRGS